MSGNNAYIRQLAEASRDMEGASLTIGARIDDDLADTIRETMRLPQFADGASASDLAISIFGDAGNSHVLAVDTRLLQMRDAGEVAWERGLFRFVEPVEGPAVEMPRRDYELVNRQGCVFDRLSDATIEEAIEWASGRGRDEYRLVCRAYGMSILVEVWNADMYRREALGLPALSLYIDQWADDEEEA